MYMCTCSCVHVHVFLQYMCIYADWILSALVPDVIIILSDGNSKPKVHHRNP